MCAWRVLAMLRRVACVGACHNLSRTFLLCCRSGCACPSMRKHRDLCNSNNLDTSPSLYIYVHGGSSLTSIFPVSLRRSQIDGRLQTTCGVQKNATRSTMCVRVLYPLFFTAASCLFCHSIYMSRVIVLLLIHSQYVPHPTPHDVPFLASWRSLSWSSNCDPLLESIHIIRCKSFLCYQVVLCVFLKSILYRSCGHV